MATDVKAISFSGYADRPTKTYPTGASTIMLARAITRERHSEKRTDSFRERLTNTDREPRK